MPTIAARVTAIGERTVEAPWSDHEYFRGWGVFGLPLDSGHVLALRVLPENSFAPYRTVWHRDPDGRWSIFADAPRLDIACPRYYGPACHYTGHARIGVEWTSGTTLRITVDKPSLAWTLSVHTSPTLASINAVSAVLPLASWRSGPLVRARERIAHALGMGDLTLFGTFPSGHVGTVMPKRMYYVDRSQATLEGVDLGRPTRVDKNPMIGNVPLPARGVLVIGQAMLKIRDPQEFPPQRGAYEGEHMNTDVRHLDTADLEARINAMYEQVAREPHREFHFETGRALAERLGYPTDQLDAMPAGAVESFAGVGYFLDLAAIQPGETILDLGSGSGTDSFLAAAAARATGRVIGVDMTAAQLAKARDIAATVGATNVEFRDGHIERPPVDDSSVDCVISNGVINLAPDKQVVFQAAAAALRPGGRLAIADIVTAIHLPSGITCDASLWAACIGGAAQRDDYIAAIRAAGFDVDVVRDNDAYRFLSGRAIDATAKYGVSSISLLATRH